ncbi:stage IV sporulation protein FA [Oikeobacillus pervagus]|uniref:Stage IV sporulation protein FA n=1 Tax=Oikeobacillus pervagus TaxID=1325931 RepID=A0AAJ1SXS6_9BACI|nr:M23 family metallopeptidase [Oikeobacillus pervagus]MDQ0214559.1 stage IV sporulation protein FA [Oikeobacillus pervagus]
MRNRADEIRRRIAKRNKLKQRKQERPFSQYDALWVEEENPYEDRTFSYEEGSDEHHPLFKKEWIMMKILGAALLVLSTAIIMQNPSPIFDDGKKLVEHSMKKEFQFAAIGDWYEQQFGKPLAFLPTKNEGKHVADQENQAYALPASGRIVEKFEADGKGVMIEIGKDEKVEAMNSGLVIFAGKKKDLGNTVIIQHPDKTETWYGHLQSIAVHQYDRVEAGKTVGSVKEREEGQTGEFYFAMKKGDDFIDPIQVITFE